MCYIVRSVRETGTITYHCASTHTALETVNAFKQAEYRDITVTTADDRSISEGQLASLANQPTIMPCRA